MVMDKKGELTASQIITFVLLAIGLVVVILFIVFLKPGSQSTEDACHLSVIARATTPSVGQKIVPLKCKAQKICMSDKSSGGCQKDFGNDKNVDPIILKGSAREMASTIEEATANEMYDCWKMMGEGKLGISYKTESVVGLTPVRSLCVVCSRVAVDITDAARNDEVMKLVDLNDYMKRKQVPGSQYTYLQTFTDRGVGAYAKANVSYLKEFETNSDINGKTIGNNPSKNQIAFVFMQIKTDSVENVLKNMALAGGTVAGAVFMTPILGSVAKRLVFTPVGAAVAVVGAGALAVYGYSNVIAGQENAAGYCGEFTSREKAAKGCSMVQAIDYNAADINALCYDIEGEI
jgi:hypothetical protein